jgi:hypothetical protein
LFLALNSYLCASGGRKKERSMKTIALAFVLLLTLSSQAAVSDRTILACTGEGDGWTSEFTLSDFGRASLKVQKKGVPAAVCEMKIKDFNYSENSEIPNISFEFDRKPCTPLLGQKSDHELLNSIVLMIELGHVKKSLPSPGVLHWLRYSQSNRCVLKTYDRFSIKMAFDGWKKGLWPN